MLCRNKDIYRYGTWWVFQDECGELVTHIQLAIVTAGFARLGYSLLLGVNLQDHQP